MMEEMNDAEWHKMIDDNIAKLNETRGVETMCSAPEAILSNEHERGINNSLVTADLIRHYADAIGDPNPLFRSPNYGKASRWGSVIGPPTFETTIAYGTSFGGSFKLPGVRSMAAGNKHEYFKVFRPGDEIRVVDKFLGFDEHTKADKPYRLFIGSTARIYTNQRDEIASLVTSRKAIIATPPSKQVGGRMNMYKDRKRHVFTKEEIEVIHRGYDDTLSGTNRRGKNILYWEDVKEGEELTPVVKGPYDVCDAGARTTVSCYSFAFAIKWAAMREHLHDHPIDPETGEYRFIRDWHYEDHIAQMLGMPFGFAAGAHNEMMLVHIVTDWMGDDGFVKSIDSRDVRINILGDMTWVKGKVVKKYVENNEHLVDLHVWGENQEGVIHTTSEVTVKLVSKSIKPMSKISY
jgi:acyl dehydratase